MAKNSQEKFKITKSKSSSAEYYPISGIDYNQEKIKTKKNKFINYSKNAVKSVKNLAFDVIGSYVPAAKDLKETLNQSWQDTDASIKDTITKAKTLSAKALGFIGIDTAQESGGGKVKPMDLVKKLIKANTADIADRLKKGNFYYSEHEDNDSDDMFGAMGFDGFDSFGGESYDDAYTEPSSAEYSAPETSLSEEPFGEAHTTVQKRITAGRRSRIRKNLKTRGYVKAAARSSRGSSQLRLGDQLIANSNQSAAQALMYEQEQLFNRQTVIAEMHHNAQLQVQTNILNGVNAAVQHLQTVEGTLASASMEYQGKIIAFQQDNLSALKEIKDTVVNIWEERKQNEASVKEQLSSKKSDGNSILKLFSGNNSINYEEYKKNIKNNFTNEMSNNSIGQILGFLPMITSFLDMSDMMGDNKPNVLGSILKAGLKGFIPKTAQNSLDKINNIFENFGTLFTGKMNELSEYGGNGIVKLIGKVLGAKMQTSATESAGLKDVYAQVQWTAQSDRSLNVVIPGYLSKMLAALTNSEEQIYDYSKGGFVEKSFIINKHKRIVEESKRDSYLDKQLASMRSNIKAEAQDQGIESEKLKKDFNQITRNIADTEMPFNPALLKYDDYKKKLLLENVDEKSLELFTQSFMANGGNGTDFNIRVRKLKYNIDKVKRENTQKLLENGGSYLAAQMNNEDRIKEIKRELENIPDYEKIKGDPKSKENQKKIESNLKNANLKKKYITELNEIKGAAGAYTGSSVVSGLSSSGNTAADFVNQNSVKILTNIYDLLTDGIIVYPKIIEGVPDHIEKINKHKEEVINRQKQEDHEKETEKLYYKKEEEKSKTNLDKYKDYTKNNGALSGGILDVIPGVLGAGGLNKSTGKIGQSITKLSNTVLGALNGIFNGFDIDISKNLDNKTDFEKEYNEQREKVEKAADFFNKHSGDKFTGGMFGKLYDVYKAKLEKANENYQNMNFNTGEIGPRKESKIGGSLKKLYNKFIEDTESPRTVQDTVNYTAHPSQIENKTANTIANNTDSQNKYDSTDEGFLNTNQNSTDNKEKNSAGELAHDAKETVLEAAHAAKNVIQDKYDAVKNSTVEEAVNTVGGKINSAIPAPVKEEIGKVIGLVKDKTSKHIPRQIKNITNKGKNFIQEKYNGVKDSTFGELTRGVKETAGGISDTAADTVKNIIKNTSAVLEDKITEVINRKEAANEEVTLEDIENTVNEEVENKTVDPEIGKKILDAVKERAKNGKERFNPASEFIKILYSLKESISSKTDLSKKERERKGIIAAVVSKIGKAGIKGIAATALLVTGHPLLAAAVALGPKKIGKGLASIAKFAVTAPFKTAKAGVKLAGKITQKDTVKKEDSEDSEDIQARNIIKNTATVLEDKIAETVKAKKAANEEVTLEDIENTVNEEVKNGNVDPEVGKKLIETTKENAAKDKENFNPLKSFIGILNNLKESAGAKKERERKGIIAAVVSKIGKAGIKGIAATALLVTGHPLLAAAVALGPKKIGKGLASIAKFAVTAPFKTAKAGLDSLANSNETAGAEISTESENTETAAIPNLFNKGKKELSERFKPYINGIGKKISGIKNNFLNGDTTVQAEPAKQSDSGGAEISTESKNTEAATIPNLFNNGDTAVQAEPVEQSDSGGAEISAESKNTEAAKKSSLFDRGKEVLSNFFQPHREGSYEDKIEDARRRREDEVQEEILQNVKEINENTDDENEEKEKRKESKKLKRLKELSKKLGIGAAGAAGVSGAGGLLGGLFGGGGTDANGDGVPDREGGGGLLDTAKDKVIGKVGTKVFGALAKRGGVLGKIGNIGRKVMSLSGTAGGTAGKTGGLMGKAAGLLGKSGSLGGKAAGLLGKAGGLGSKAGGLLGGLGGIAKAAGPIGLAITAAQAIGGGVDGWRNAGDIAGLAPGQKASTGQKVGSAVSGALGNVGGVLNVLTGKKGLLGKLSGGKLGFDINAKSIYGLGKNIGNGLFGEYEPVIDENGRPVIDSKTGQPKMKRKGGGLLSKAGKHYITGGGLVGMGVRKLISLNKKKKDEEQKTETVAARETEDQVKTPEYAKNKRIVVTSDGISAVPTDSEKSLSFNSTSKLNDKTTVKDGEAAVNSKDTEKNRLTNLKNLGGKALKFAAGGGLAGLALRKLTGSDSTFGVLKNIKDKVVNKTENFIPPESKNTIEKGLTNLKTLGGKALKFAAGGSLAGLALRKLTGSDSTFGVLKNIKDKAAGKDSGLTIDAKDTAEKGIDNLKDISGSITSKTGGLVGAEPPETGKLTGAGKAEETSWSVKSDETLNTTIPNLLTLILEKIGKTEASAAQGAGESYETEGKAKESLDGSGAGKKDKKKKEMNFFGKIEEGVSNAAQQIGSFASNVKDNIRSGFSKASESVSNFFSGDSNKNKETSIGTGIGDIPRARKEGGKVFGVQIPVRDSKSLSQVIHPDFAKPADASAYLTESFGRYSDMPKDHVGIDIGDKGNSNALNRAAADGEVVRAVDGFKPEWDSNYYNKNKKELVEAFGPAAAYGNHVTVKTKDGSYFTYAHQEMNAVKVGDKVKKGDPVGKMGNTGNSMGKHLHLQLMGKDGQIHDPLEYIASGELSKAALSPGEVSKEITKPNTAEDASKKANTIPVSGEAPPENGGVYKVEKGGPGFKLTAVTPSVKRLEKGGPTDNIGSSTFNPVKLQQSPIVTNDNQLTSKTLEAIDIQNAVHKEQLRHNSITEEFFTNIMNAVQALIKSQAGSLQSTLNSFNVQQNSMKNNSQEVGRGKDTVMSSFVGTARRMAGGLL